MKIQCEYCKRYFDKSEKRVNQTEKLGQRHTCSRKCSSALANEKRRCEPTTTNAKYVRADKDKFPERDHARSLVRRAIRSGQITQPKECDLCYEEGVIEAHHPDHDYPFLLLFLCQKCHRQADSSPDRYEGMATDYSKCIK